MRLKFDEIGVELVKSMQVNREGQCLTSAGIPINADLLPSINTLEKIKSLRSTTIATLLTILHKHLDMYMYAKQPLCRRQFNTQECDDTTLGSLITNSRRIGCWPKWDPTMICVNVLTLAQNIQDTLYKITRFSSHTCGRAKFRKMLKNVDRVLNDIPCPTTETDILHIAQQAQKMRT